MAANLISEDQLTLVFVSICVLGDVYRNLQNHHKDPFYHEDAQGKTTKPNKDGAVSANNLVSKHPTVNQSFIDKIVAEIEAKHPFIAPLLKTNGSAVSGNDSTKGKKYKSRSGLQQLIDNVADNVVKEVTAEFRGGRLKPSRSVTSPKQSQKSEDSMPLLNDNQSTYLDLKTPSGLESTLNKLHTEDGDDLLPEVVSLDDLTRDDPPLSTPADTTQPSTTSQGQESLLQSKNLSKGNHPSRGPNPERPGLDDIQQMFRTKNWSRSKSHLKTTKPATEKGKKKLIIPATTEGRSARIKGSKNYI